MKLPNAMIGIPLILGSPLLTQTATAADGAALYKAKGCPACHGPTGMGTIGPRLAGLQANYLLEQFKLIRDKKRTTGKANLMAAAVSKVTDEEEKAITDYLSKLK